MGWLRILKHSRLDAADTTRLLGAGALQRIEARVAASEAGHSGEIRVSVEAGLPLSYLRRDASARERAVMLFGKLRVWDTEHNNGVLIYLMLAEHAIEIVADRGLARRVDPGEWQEASATVTPSVSCWLEMDAAAACSPCAALREPANADPLGEFASDGDLLAAALDHERAGRDPGNAFDACTFGHAEAQRLNAGVLVVHRDDLDLLALTDAVKRTHRAHSNRRGYDFEGLSYIDGKRV